MISLCHDGYSGAGAVQESFPGQRFSVTDVAQGQGGAKGASQRQITNATTQTMRQQPGKTKRYVAGNRLRS